MGALTDWSVASRTMPGERECGDAHVLVELPDAALAAVIDGLGHGSEAAVAARAAVATIAAHPDEPIEMLLARCHEQLRGTRGAVMTIASFRRMDGTLTWIGVGNVDAVLIHAHARAARQSILLRGGVVGYRVPAVRPVTLPIAAGDTLILATDGIRSAFSENLDMRASPAEIAQHVLERHGKNTDDALVLVARWQGTVA
jgi:serine/threonine protein phosphatase PrpC